MAGAGARELLSQAILDVLGGWTDLHRQVFVKAHYQGQSVDAISGLLGMPAPEVRRILDNCDRRLRAALRSFREEVCEGAICAPDRPPVPDGKSCLA
jgi:DNA-directed RNA polymerase specialized sigma24 family protein